MANKFALICLGLALTTSVFAQTSQSEKTGFWTNTSTWVTSVVPGTVSGGTITMNLKTVVINGSVKVRENLTLNTSSLTINAGDTLAILGNVTLSTASTLTNNGVLMVMGNFSNAASNNVVSSTGKMVVTGNYTNTIGLSNTFTGPSYVYGTTSGFLFAPGVGNEAALTAADAALHDVVGVWYASLPVELTSFTARTNSNNDVLITWATASETNNDHFLLERASDDRKFLVINLVAGAGNSTKVNNYEVNDNTAPIGQSYYRLSQIDLDGKTTIFDLISVYKTSSHITLYPNPTVSYVLFNVADKNYTVFINDAKGTPYTQFNHISEISEGKYGLDAHTLNSGMYHVKLVNDLTHETSSFTFIKH